MLRQTTTYVKSYDGQTKGDDLLEEYNTILYKVSANIKKEFDSQPIYNKVLHGGEVADFYDKRIPKVDSNHTQEKCN